MRATSSRVTRCDADPITTMLMATRFVLVFDARLGAFAAVLGARPGLAAGLGVVWGGGFAPACGADQFAICVFRTLTPVQVRALSRQVFVRFAQAWLDRGWLWHGAPDNGARAFERHRCGAMNSTGADPVVIFAPHFVGLDAGWTALTQQLPRHFTTIYTDQANKVADAWILQGRQRFGSMPVVWSGRWRQNHRGHPAPGRSAVPAAGHELWPARVAVCAVLWRELRPRCHRCRALPGWVVPRWCPW